MSAFASRFPLRWVCYLAYFVGVSFQSGGIVHYSIDPGRYGKLVVIGAVIFIIGAIASDLTETESRLRTSGPIGFATFIVSSLILSIGVGMIGGAVQHFLDIPTRAPYLIGMGLVLSAIGFHGRFRPHKHATEMVVSIALVGLLAVPIVAILRSYSTRLPEATEGHSDGHGDSHGGEAAAAAKDGGKKTASVPTTNNIPPTESTQLKTSPAPISVGTTPNTAPASDGHDDHAHEPA